VIGILDGFEWVMHGNIDHVVPLDIAEVSRIHFRGGSYIASRAPTPRRIPSISRTPSSHCCS